MEEERYKRTLAEPYSLYTNNSGLACSNMPLDRHNVLKDYLCADLDSVGGEIPTMFIPDLINILNCEERVEYRQIAMPLFWSSAITYRAFSSSFIQKFFSTGLNTRLTKIIVSRTGDTYYGGNGIILGEDMNPYVLYTVTASKISMEKLSNIKVAHIKAEALNVRIAPEVFLQDNSLKKHIVKQMIPLLTSISLNKGSINVDIDEPLTPRIIIEDLSGWIKHPSSPEVSRFNETMSQFLSREDIIQDIIKCL